MSQEAVSCVAMRNKGPRCSSRDQRFFEGLWARNIRPCTLPGTRIRRWTNTASEVLAPRSTRGAILASGVLFLRVRLVLATTTGAQKKLTAWSWVLSSGSRGGFHKLAVLVVGVLVRKESV